VLEFNTSVIRASSYPFVLSVRNFVGEEAAVAFKVYPKPTPETRNPKLETLDIHGQPEPGRSNTEIPNF